MLQYCINSKKRLSCKIILQVLHTKWCENSFYQHTCNTQHTTVHLVFFFHVKIFSCCLNIHIGLLLKLLLNVNNSIKTTMVEVEHSMSHAIIKNNEIDMNVYVIHEHLARSKSCWPSGSFIPIKHSKKNVVFSLIQKSCGPFLRKCCIQKEISMQNEILQ